MDISRSELGLLMTLDVLLKERNVTKAARVLGISQPALSAQLQRLRHLFGDPLLVPGSKGMVPTERASAITSDLHSLLENLIRLIRERQVFDPRTSTRQFRVAATDYAHSAVSSHVVAAVNSVAPYVSLLFEPIRAETLANDIEVGPVDFVIASEALIPPHARALPLFTDRYVMVQKLGHPRGTNQPDLDGYCSLKHLRVSLDRRSGSGAVDDILHDLGRSRRIVASLPSYSAAPQIIAQSDLVVTLPSRVAAGFSRVEIYELPFESPTLRYFLGWHNRSQSDLSHRWLRKLVISQFSEAPLRPIFAENTAIQVRQFEPKATPSQVRLCNATR